jgi:hypothetical protein
VAVKVFQSVLLLAVSLELLVLWELLEQVLGLVCQAVQLFLK